MSKTSVDILHERDSFRLRVNELEAALKRIVDETEQALRTPELSLLTLCRVSSLARLAIEETDPSTVPSAVHAKLARCARDDERATESGLRAKVAGGRP
jgi:hypothetical protein